MSRRNVKNLRMIRRLLERPDGSWTMYGLAKESGASQPYGVKVVHQLERMGFLRSTKVIDIEGLARYAARKMPSHILTAEFYVPDPLEFLRRNAKTYAVTTYFAENLITHHLFPSRCDVYVIKGEMERLKPCVLKEGLIGKGNTRLMVPVDEWIVDESWVVRGIHVVALGQLMIDLMHEGGVCMEAFDMMVKHNVREG